jgi:EAL domain-containing protein (putative c-di-GMP-specific phosphodiesterase class I)/CheY-like chemotaxis protein
MLTNLPLPLLLRLRGALVIDDSPVQRLHAVQILKQAGISRVHEACDGRDGLEAIRRITPSPALLVVDLEMPNMDGIEMLQALSTENYRPPILIASASPTSLVASIETMCRELGLPILGAFKKPFTHEILNAALQSFERIINERQGTHRDDTEVSPDKLAAALESHEIVPYYQPKVCLKTGNVVGVEALARWIDPINGIISPAAFIPVAEECGLITRLTLSILDDVLLQNQHWLDAGLDLFVSVNLSAQSLTQRNFIDTLILRTRESNLDPAKIIFEVTESNLIADMGAGLGALGRLRLKGFGLSMDDYGTGFSTTQQLSRLPLTELKVDRSFVSQAPEKPNLKTILGSVIHMGLDLGLQTLVEGVETESELRLVQQLGSHQVQGFLIARPMPGADILNWHTSEAEAVRTRILKAWE